MKAEQPSQDQRAEVIRRNLFQSDTAPYARIPIVFLRDKQGNTTRMRTVPFKPGLIIERNGRRYQVDEKGTQRRIG